MHCLILRVPARAGGISRRQYLVTILRGLAERELQEQRRDARQRHRSAGTQRGRSMLCAAGVFEKRWTQTYSTDERQALCETWGCSSAGRAPALQAGGRQFDSVHLHQLHWRQFAPTDRCNDRDQEGTKRSRAKHRSADRWQGHGRPQKWAHSSGG